MRTTARAGSDPGYRMGTVAQPSWHTTLVETMTPVEWSADETASAISARDGQAGDAAAVGEAGGWVGAVAVGRAGVSAFALSSPDRQAVDRQARVTTATRTAGRNGDTRPPPSIFTGESCVAPGPVCDQYSRGTESGV